MHFRNNDFQDGKRPVHRAAFNGAVEVLEVLLENGASIKSKDSVSAATWFYSE